MSDVIYVYGTAIGPAFKTVTGAKAFSEHGALRGRNTGFSGNSYGIIVLDNRGNRIRTSEVQFQLETLWKRAEAAPHRSFLLSDMDLTAGELAELLGTLADRPKNVAVTAKLEEKLKEVGAFLAATVSHGRQVEVSA